MVLVEGEGVVVGVGAFEARGEGVGELGVSGMGVHVAEEEGRVGVGVGGLLFLRS
jgi:hypothetical protein